MISKLIATIKKETLLLLRDKVGLSILFLMPMILIFVMTLIQDAAFKTINEKAITGKSGLGDCVNKYKTGRKIKFIHDFFSNI